ncbi:hypothetical protein CJF32_00000128 [Rutstroemia sp. NJR-2017a WRK4]|nr:hypothetical protein CJF32_00000128 [Rutstroemia sp. NJR-2017a WRK4]
MSFESLSERLAALQESNRQARELIDRLETIKFQPGSVPLNGDDENVKSELTAEIAQILKDQNEDYELLQEQILSLPTGRPGSEVERQRHSLENAVKRDMKEVEECYKAFRKAQITAKKRLKLAQQIERAALLQSSLSPSRSSTPNSMDRPFSRPNATLSKEEKEVHASSDVTLALRRTHEMMAGELQKSQFAHETLKQSTETLAQLSENYSTLDTLLSSSKNLLGTLLTSQKSDTWYLESAFYILICTISWLVFRRFFYGPLWWLVYAPLKLSFSTLFGVVGLFGSKGGSAVESAGPVSGGKNGQNIASSRIENAKLNNENVPVIEVGSQGKGSLGRKGASQDAESSTASSVTEEVERIIDRIDEQLPGGEDGEVQPGSEEFDPETGSKGYLSGDEKAQEREGNPKRRMWEEPQEAVREEQRVRDEL